MKENQSLQTTTDAPIVPADVSAGALESAIGLGDLSRLTATDRLKLVAAICQTVGLNPLTRPFDYITLQGKLTLYANKGCAEQLRKLHKVSIEFLERKQEGGCYVVRVKATDATGRTDEATGVVPCPAQAQGEALAMAMMKAETKAKRRVTLSICGLGMLDESELESVQNKRTPAAVLDSAEDVTARAALLGGVVKHTERTIEVEAVNDFGESPVRPESEVLPTAPESPATPVPLEVASAPAKVSPPALTQVAPAAPANGKLDDETVRNLEVVLSEKGPLATRFLIARGKLKAGDGLERLDATAANFCLVNTRRFYAMVDKWQKEGGK